MAAPLHNNCGFRKKFSHTKGVLPPKEWRGRAFRAILGKTPDSEILAKSHRSVKNQFQPAELVIVQEGDRLVFGHVSEAFNNICMVLTAPSEERSFGGHRYFLAVEEIGKISYKIAQICINLESCF